MNQTQAATPVLIASALTPGFDDPVLDAQACFRAVLDAMSRPGRLLRLAVPPEPPSGLSPAAAAVLLTLADADTPLRLAAGPVAEAWARFHCGAPPAEAAEALFVLDAEARIAALHPGTDEEPETGATLILEVAGFLEGADVAEGTGWRLTGPGIECEHRLAVIGAPPGFLGADFLADWAANGARYPRGVDVILCAGDSIAALPRTTRIKAL